MSLKPAFDMRKETFKEWKEQFGAEMTQVYARRYGSNIVPDEDAVRVREVKEVVEDGRGTPKRPPRTSRQEPRRV